MLHVRQSVDAKASSVWRRGELVLPLLSTLPSTSSFQCHKGVLVKTLSLGLNIPSDQPTIARVLTGTFRLSTLHIFRWTICVG